MGAADPRRKVSRWHRGDRNRLFRTRLPPPRSWPRHRRPTWQPCLPQRRWPLPPTSWTS